MMKLDTLEVHDRENPLHNDIEIQLLSALNWDSMKILDLETV